MTLQNNARTSPASSSAGRENDDAQFNARGGWGKSTRLEFPKFDGEGFDGWLMRVEYFFEVADVAAADRVKVAALHLDGKALQWHRGFIGLKGELAYGDWPSYIHALAARFGSKAFEDPLSDLRNLKQVTSLQHYMDCFDELYPRTGIKEDQALSFFLSGLIDELQMPVRMFKPSTLADAYALAKLQELTVAAIHSRPKPHVNHMPYSSTAKPLSVTTTSIRPSFPPKEPPKQPLVNVPRPNPRITNKEMDDRRSKGLCFWCEEKYTPNHNFPKKRLYVMHLVEDDVENCSRDVLTDQEPTEL